MERVKVKLPKGGPGEAMIVGSPTECPVCDRRINPIEWGFHCGCNEKSRVFGIFQCPDSDCEHLFVATFAYRDGGTYAFFRSDPKYPAQPAVPEEVRQLSSQFVEIYSQALAAESFGLSQLTGGGLRKALEFLVKDYAIHTKPEAKNEIEKSYLANCIQDYIDDPNTKKVAQFAAWLGNDESHYVRRWQDKDISDLKILVKLAMQWIDNVLVTERYTKDMNPETD